MKFLIAGFSHETNTFSPVETPLGRFCLDGRNLLGGDAALKLFRGTETCLGGFIAVAERSDAAIELPVAAFAPPSRRVSRQAYEAITRSEEHTSELQSLMRISYAVFCLKKKK